ncbi:HAD family hydrolase [Peteryoungia desertarenae]|nr:HAD family hydrolase [Peteryoungia desertarenae]
MMQLPVPGRHLPALPLSSTAEPDFELAKRHLPILMLDTAEPFAPLVAGYAVYREKAKSRSSKFRLYPRAAAIIEYALWYDWDIQHLYDLEHVWVHIDDTGQVVTVEASRHGARLPMRRPDQTLPVEGQRPLLYVEPGKHAHWADPAEMKRDAGVLVEAMCSAFAGDQGIHLSNRFSQQGQICASLFENRLARLKLKRLAFKPSWNFNNSLDAQPALQLVPWEILEDWIPQRFEALVSELPGTVPHLAAVFLDCGDTLVDERTEVKRPGTDIVITGDLIPGANAMISELKAAGHRLCLVADGPRETFENLLQLHDLWTSFDAHIISGDIGELKPSPKMFQAACAAMGLHENDRDRTVMVGNNLERDIVGANRFGLISIFLAWSTRRSHKPRLRDERPRLTIRQITELPGLLERIELSLPNSAVQGGRT